MGRHLRCALLSAASVLLTACAGTTTLRGALPEDNRVNTYQLQGRFAVQSQGEAVSGRITWSRQANEERVLLQDPFGSGIGELVQDATGAQLRMADGRMFAADNGEALLANVTGVRVPLGALGRWLTGQGGPTDEAEIERDASGRALAFRHDGWQVEYRYSDGVRLPAGIRARRDDGTQLRLSIEHWELSP